MKKIPVYASILLIAGVLATMAFSHPLVVRNGVVTSYTANGSIEIQNRGVSQDYMLAKNVSLLPQNSGTELGTGAKVTVVAECFHSGAFNRNASEKAAGSGNSGTANMHACVALAVIVRGPAAGAVPATGGTGGAAATGTSTPATGTGGAVGTMTPAAGSTTVGTATPMVCPPLMGTATPATGTTGAATATVIPCVTATPTP